MRWSEDDGHVSVYRYPSNNSNGNTRDREGRLISCEHDAQRLTRTEHDGSITVLIDRFEGKRLNAPNDVVVSADGAIWFTDPLFGNLGNYEGHRITPELPTQVYRLDPRTGRATVVATGIGGPDGIAFSPDEKKLYIADTGVQSSIGRDSNIRVYDVVGEKLANEKIFVPTFGATGRTDGVRTDMDGNVWITMGNGDPNEFGVRCYAPNGNLIGKIHIPETCAFCASAVRNETASLFAGAPRSTPSTLKRRARFCRKRLCTAADCAQPQFALSPVGIRSV